MRSLILTIACLIFCLSTNPAQAKQKLDLQEFKKITIVKDGRMKPMETYARNLLLRFSGKTSIERRPAVEWLAELIFQPEQTYDLKVFLINNPEVLEAIGVEPDAHRKYSFNELKLGMEKLIDYASTAMTKEEKDRTNLEKEFLRVFFNFHAMVQVMNSTLVTKKHEDFKVSEQTRNMLQLESKENSLFNILIKANEIGSLLESLDTRNSFELEGNELLGLSLNLYSWIENHNSYSSLFNDKESLSIFPVACKQGKSCSWLSSWDLILEENSGIESNLKSLEKISRAYISADQSSFDSEIKKFKQDVKSNLSKNQIRPPQTQVELFYNMLNPFLKAKLLYGFAFLAIMLSFVCFGKSLQLSSVILSTLGFLVHLLGIACRVIILNRPPVSNLFETFIFVAMISVMLGLALCLLDRQSKLGPLLSSVSGLVLLLISGKFAAEGDTMEVLIAVLNSNFWLSTHVICITIGYAGVFAAGLVGHYYLIKRLSSIDELENKRLVGIMLGILGFGLVFSFLGTMLGGIWADQSWGRFWGWDPKENGALLIVLWTSILFHARLSGMIKDIGLAIGAVLADAVVITSWFGINLLGVGLHSYGFTQGIAISLYSFYAIELIFIIIMLVLLNRKQITK